MSLDIKKVIKQKGLEVKDVAARMNITPVGLSQHINGNPSVSVLERIAKAIGCDVGDFFTRSVPDAPTITCPHCGKSIRVSLGCASDAGLSES